MSVIQVKKKMFKVVNGYKSGFIGENKIYIGRANKKLNLQNSPLANPYVIGKDGDRDEVVHKYRVWLNEQVKVRNKIYDYLVNLSRLHQSPDEFFLVCYCFPNRCHGDIVINALNYILENNNEKS